ncbi:hypothetical protein FA15DRAFT_710249 [Coprinopsis marcescibilis]|uniref:CBM1 domain-containing protein n=1 Tax=Coprinopsis marcescibilis TaxID=230819 RepID=A0A5C3KDA0_COPMA|nr:hypothetical protein FA15DRAFT_710249 [Coprinopsis marcescibilis]
MQLTLNLSIILFSVAVEGAWLHGRGEIRSPVAFETAAAAVPSPVESAIAAAITATPTYVLPYAECGGIGYTGPTQCAPPGYQNWSPHYLTCELDHRVYIPMTTWQPPASPTIKPPKHPSATSARASQGAPPISHAQKRGL